MHFIVNTRRTSAQLVTLAIHVVKASAIVYNVFTVSCAFSYETRIMKTVLCGQVLSKFIISTWAYANIRSTNVNFLTSGAHWAGDSLKQQNSIIIGNTRTSRSKQTSKRKYYWHLSVTAVPADLPVVTRIRRQALKTIQDSTYCMTYNWFLVYLQVKRQHIVIFKMDIGKVSTCTR